VVGGPDQRFGPSAVARLAPLEANPAGPRDRRCGVGIVQGGEGPVGGERADIGCLCYPARRAGQNVAESNGRRPDRTQRRVGAQQLGSFQAAATTNVSSDQRG